MGFMDKAKKLAEQAQEKLDEAQQSFNEGGSTPGSRAEEPATTSTDARSRTPRPRPQRRRPRASRSPRPPSRSPSAGRPGRRVGCNRAHGAPAAAVRRRRRQRQPRPVQAAPAVIGGILTAMVTPFDADGGLDEERGRRLIHHLLDNGSDGLVLAGTTGEAATLTDEEKVRLWELAVAEAGDATVIAGTGTYDTRHSVELTERATEAGVDAVLVVTPYYNKPNRRGHRGPLRGGRGRHRPAGDPLQHPLPHRDRHAQRPARRARPDRERRGRQAGPLRGPRADRRARPARGQRRHARQDAGHGRDRRHPGRLAPGRARDAPDDRRARAPPRDPGRRCATSTRR